MELKRDLLAIVESPLRSDVDGPAWLETALDDVDLVKVLVPPTAATPCAEHAGGGGGTVDLLALHHQTGVLAGLGAGGALHLLLLQVEVDGVLVVVVRLLRLGGLLLQVPGIEKHVRVLLSILK